MTTHRAQLGRFFEDFVVGDSYEHPLGRTINDADNTWFTLLTCNTNQSHFNAHLAATNPISEGRIIVNSGLTVALVLGLSVMDMSQNAVANLGWTDIRLLNPVFVGDTLYAWSRCTALRESESRPTFGIVTMNTIGIKQDGQEVISWTRSAMIPKRSTGIGEGYFPRPGEPTAAGAVSGAALGQ
jgi:acyl dehydratase